MLHHNNLAGTSSVAGSTCKRSSIWRSDTAGGMGVRHPPLELDVVVEKSRGGLLQAGLPGHVNARCLCKESTACLVLL